MITPIAELIQNHQVFFETIWVLLAMASFSFMLLSAVFKDVKESLWHECMFVSLWCLGASILVLLASV